MGKVTGLTFSEEATEVATEKDTKDIEEANTEKKAKEK